MRVQDPASIALAIFGVLFIGLSKAGFGGGLGMLTTPVCVLAFGPQNAIGILLPLLCAGDAFSLYHYWDRWERKHLRFLMLLQRFITKVEPLALPQPIRVVLQRLRLHLPSLVAI